MLIASLSLPVSLSLSLPLSRTHPYKLEPVINEKRYANYDDDDDDDSQSDRARENIPPPWGDRK